MIEEIFTSAMKDTLLSLGGKTVLSRQQNFLSELICRFPEGRHLLFSYDQRGAVYLFFGKLYAIRDSDKPRAIVLEPITWYFDALYRMGKLDAMPTEAFGSNTDYALSFTAKALPLILTHYDALRKSISGAIASREREYAPYILADLTHAPDPVAALQRLQDEAHPENKKQAQSTANPKEHVTFERGIPDGYRLVKHIDATKGKDAIVFNVVALLIYVLIYALAFLPFLVSGKDVGNFLSSFVTSFAIALIPTLLYVVLHELTHGFVYKRDTGEKLTFGLTLTCAFCGVPHIYTYRRPVRRASIAPFALFTAILLPLTVLFYFIDPTLYFASAFLFATHFGGCAGDLYVFFLTSFRYKDDRLLVKDTGPEQFFYLPAAD